jgi:hypothetical protein
MKCRTFATMVCGVALLCLAIVSNASAFGDGAQKDGKDGCAQKDPGKDGCAQKDGKDGCAQKGVCAAPRMSHQLFAGLRDRAACNLNGCAQKGGGKDGCAQKDPGKDGCAQKDGGKDGCAQKDPGKDGCAQKSACALPKLHRPLFAGLHAKAACSVKGGDCCGAAQKDGCGQKDGGKDPGKDGCAQKDGCGLGNGCHQKDGGKDGGAQKDDKGGEQK